MNDTVDLAAADRYFEHHPQGKFWNGIINPEARLGALRVAEIDITCTVGTDHIPDNDEVRYAWFEQALYLICHPDAPDDGSVQSESIEGLGARTYSGKRHFLAPRAEQILAPYLRSLAVAILRG